MGIINIPPPPPNVLQDDAVLQKLLSLYWARLKYTYVYSKTFSNVNAGASSNDMFSHGFDLPDSQIYIVALQAKGSVDHAWFVHAVTADDMYTKLIGGAGSNHIPTGNTTTGSILIGVINDSTSQQDITVKALIMGFQQ